MTDTGNELSEILSAETAPAATATVETTTTTAPPADTGQGRDEHGRFAPKATDTQPPPVDTSTQPPATGQPPASGTVPEGYVPHGRFHAVNETAKAEKERADRLEAMLEQALRRTGQPAPAAAPQTEPPKPKDLWEDPNGFTEDVVSKALTPLQEQMREFVFNTSKREATREFGAEKITAAETAMEQAIKAGRLDPKAVAAQLGKSMDPVGDVVRWHQKTSALERVGSDPDAFVKAEIEKMLADPAKAGELLQRLQSGAANANRSGTTAPVIELPPSLSKLPGGTNTAAPALGDDSERFSRALAG